MICACGKAATPLSPDDLFDSPAVAVNSIGDDGAVALGAALEPRQNPDGRWVFNTAMSTLSLRCAAPESSLIPMVDPLCGKSASLTLPNDFSALPAAAVNDIGHRGAVALGAALEPKQNPDGRWVFNTALSTLSLFGAAPAPPIAPIGDPLSGKSASLTLPGNLCALPAAAVNDIGDEGAVALGAALEPKQNPDGTWVFNTAMSDLYLNCAGPYPPLIPKVDPLCGKSASLTLPGDLCALPAAAANDFGDEGAEALGAALEPKQNPDGTWVFNTALSTLSLYSAGPFLP